AVTQWGCGRRSRKWLRKYSASGIGQPLFGQLNPVGGPKRYEVVVKVVAAVMQHARAQAVSFCAVIALAIAYPDIAAGHFLEHEGKVFGTHGWSDGGVDLRLADYAPKHLGAKGCFRLMVDGGRVAAQEGKVCLALERAAGVLGDVAHAVLD